ncbi:MAG: hypothetical protein J5644_07775 [Bacteroidales bacterium]|nr:hypothetical protein [Bacteroidales bacterium]
MMIIKENIKSNINTNYYKVKQMKTLRLLGIALMACGMLFVSCKKDKHYTITVNANDTTMGTVTGGGTYAANETVTLTATANEGYQFVKWQDGNTDNPRTITVTKDETYTATFEVLPAGVYVSFGSENWKAASFDADVETFAANNTMVIWLNKNLNSDYPQIQSRMQTTVGSSSNSSQRYVIYMENGNDVNEEGYPNWQADNLTLTVEAINLAAHTVTATVTGTLKNLTSGEIREIKINYRNAEWAPATIQSKGTFKKL